MRHFISAILLVISFSAVSQDKESLLAAWEKVQQNHSEVESFEKISANHYKIKFVNIPFEGELIVLAYAVEDIDYAPRGKTTYNNSGYLEVELVDFPEEILKKYQRTYYKWSQDNNLYFNNELKTWSSAKVFTQSFITKKDKNSLKLFLDKYKVYLLSLLLLYIIYVHLKHNKRMNTLMEGHTTAISQQNLSLELHRETNKLLVDMLKEIKQNNNKDEGH